MRCMTITLKDDKDDSSRSQSLWTNESFVKPRKYFPQYQNRMPKLQTNVMSAMVVSIGGTKPLSAAQGVMYLLTP